MGALVLLSMCFLPETVKSSLVSTMQRSPAQNIMTNNGITTLAVIAM